MRGLAIIVCLVCVCNASCASPRSRTGGLSLTGLRAALESGEIAAGSPTKPWMLPKGWVERGAKDDRGNTYGWAVYRDRRSVLSIYSRNGAYIAASLTRGGPGSHEARWYFLDAEALAAHAAAFTAPLAHP